VNHRVVGAGLTVAAILGGVLAAVGGAATQRARPDLIEARVSNPPPVVLAGSSFRLTDTVKNRGHARARSTTTHYYLAGDNSAFHALVATRVVPALPVGATSSGARRVVVTRSTPPGSYVIQVCADDTRVAKESNEQNNCRPSRPFVVKRPPPPT